ncbi:MAG: hypothetical protein [Bacteriophage sp.]|jgi:hypothetical protein|nr:MAG: hypothetical protein [Bacteriophage sp.]UWH95623.1 MAG: hypothetical protein [Bacteriophage sp.]
MRIPKKQTDYEAISRLSVKRDFQRVQTYPQKGKRPEIKKQPELNAVRRIAFVGENSSYYKQRFLIVGKLVRIIKPIETGGFICEFVHDADRRALNDRAGWSDMKKEYLFDCIKFK